MLYEGCVLVLVVSMGTVPSENSLQGTRIFRMGITWRIELLR